MESMRKITLNSSNGEAFEVDEVVALEFQNIKQMIEDICVDDGIPFPDVTSKILAKIIEYCKKHADAVAANSNDLKAWDADFVKVDLDMLFDLIRAAKYLDIQSLLDLTCKTVADKISGKTPEEMREILNLKDDFTPEEKEEIRRENQWVFE